MEKNTLIRIFASALLLFFMGCLTGQTEWELKKEEEGITAYTRKREGIKFNEYKVSMTLNADLNQVLSLFKDFEVYPELFPGTEGIKVFLDKPDHHVTYIKFNIPFPARDRDAIFDNRISYNKATKKLKVDVKCLTDEYETDESLIQIKFCEGFWEFTDLGNGSLLVEHQLIVDPAGFAPAWIVNSKTVDDPIKTLKSLKLMIKDKKYLGHSFSLLSN